MSKPKIEEKQEAVYQAEDLLDAETRQQYVEACLFFERTVDPVAQEVVNSERLTKDDFAIRINAH